jgi:tetratricopeptide (TPR) repeat protein
MKSSTRADSSRKASCQSPGRIAQQDPDTSGDRFSLASTQRMSQADPFKPAVQGYADHFFRSNPDIPIDTRSPTDKLEAIEARLQGPLSHQDRFNLLIQRKCLTFLAFGRESLEGLRAVRDLAHFYNAQTRPQSSLRHLDAAKKISESIEMPDPERLILAVEIADANLMSKGKTKQESARFPKVAETELIPFSSVQVDDASLAYRRDRLLARICAGNGDFAEAFVHFNRALETLDAANEGVPTEGTTALYIEIARIAELTNDQKRARNMYRRAYQTFRDLNMTESANMVRHQLLRFPMAESETTEGTESTRSEGVESDLISNEGQSVTERGTQPEPKPETKEHANKEVVKPEAQSVNPVEEEEDEEDDDVPEPREDEEGF